MTWSKPVLAVLVAIGASACSRATLELDPALVPACKPGYSEVVDVRWDASASGTESVSVEVLRPGTAAKQWTTGAPVGHRATGRWANDGLTFVLHAEDGRELARRTIESPPCPQADGKAGG